MHRTVLLLFKATDINFSYYSINQIPLELKNPFVYSRILKPVVHALRIVIVIAGSCCGSQCITIGKYLKGSGADKSLRVGLIARGGRPIIGPLQRLFHGIGCQSSLLLILRSKLFGPYRFVTVAALNCIHTC